MPQDDAIGNPWDVGGGLPDPFVQITLNGTLLGMTNVEQDTLTPMWNQGAMTEIPAGSSLTIDAYDSDVTSNDLILGCTGSLTADWLREDEPAAFCVGTGSFAGAQVRVFFVPQ